MAAFGIINTEYLGFITRNLETIVALFHLQGFGVCHFYRIGQRIKILVHFSAPTYATRLAHLFLLD
jgi:hypothetical protein